MRFIKPISKNSALYVNSSISAWRGKPEQGEWNTGLMTRALDRSSIADLISRAASSLEILLYLIFLPTDLATKLEDGMALVKKTIELDQEQINRIKSALNARSEKEALNAVLGQFDTEIQLAEATLRDAGTFEFEEI